MPSPPVHDYAPTAAQAALHAIYRATKKPVVLRINRSGRFAVVLTRGGMMESQPVSGPIVVKRFAFGWQPLDIMMDICSADALRRATGGRAVLRLLQGMPARLAGIAKCKIPNNEVSLIDQGPERDVAAVRKQMTGPLVPYVIVSHDWAIGEWFGAGGGQNLFHRRGGMWHFLKGGGGAMDFEYVRDFGVPFRDACTFRVLGTPASCVKR